MKTILFLILVLLFIVPVSAQHLTDSVGTANTFWQKVALNRGTADVKCEVINTGSSATDYLLLAKTHQDTVASGSAKYTSRINSGWSILFNTNQSYVYVKASANTVTYMVKTY